MSKLFKPSTRKALQFYGLLALSAFLVPKNFVTYNQFVFTFIIVAYVFGWYRVLRYLWFRSNSNDDKYRWDFLVYDLIYILGLPIILNIMMIKVGRPLFVHAYIAWIYYLAISIILPVKLLMMRTRFYYMVRFVILMLFFLLNVVVIQQIFNIWYGVHFLGQGF